MVGKDLGDQAKGTGAYTGGGKGGGNFNASNTGGPTSVDRTRTTETQNYNTYKATGKNPLNLDIERIERFGGPTLTPREILKKKTKIYFMIINLNIHHTFQSICKLQEILIENLIENIFMIKY